MNEQSNVSVEDVLSEMTSEGRMDFQRATLAVLNKKLQEENKMLRAVLDEQLASRLGGVENEESI